MIRPFSTVGAMFGVATLIFATVLIAFPMPKNKILTNDIYQAINFLKQMAAAALYVFGALCLLLSFSKNKVARVFMWISILIILGIIILGAIYGFFDIWFTGKINLGATLLFIGTIGGVKA